MMLHPYDVIFIGLALDLGGGIALAKSFMLKRRSDAHVESLTVSGANSFYIRSALLQRAEAWVGGSLLSIGFILQMLGNLHGGVATSDLGWIRDELRMGLLLGAAFLITASLLALAHRLADREWYRRMCRGKPFKPIEWKGDATEIDRCLLVMRMRRRRGESDEALRDRIERRWQKVWRRYSA